MVDVGQVGPPTRSTLHVHVTLHEPAHDNADHLVATQVAEFRGDPVVAAALLRRLADKLDPPRPPHRRSVHDSDASHTSRS